MTNIKFPAVMEGAIGSETIQTVNARDLHAFLEVGRDFSNWLKDRIEQYGFIENVDYVLTVAKIGERKNVKAATSNIRSIEKMLIFCEAQLRQ